MPFKHTDWKFCRVRKIQSLRKSIQTFKPYQLRICNQKVQLILEITSSTIRKNLIFISN
jgi:hypothetical protein